MLIVPLEVTMAPKRMPAAAARDFLGCSSWLDCAGSASAPIVKVGAGAFLPTRLSADPPRRPE